jgi:hypothetical protein
MQLVLLNVDQTIDSKKTFAKDVTLEADMALEGKLTATEALRNEKNIGVAGADTVSVIEYGDGINHVTKLTLTDFVVGPLAGAGAALTLVPPTPIYTFPAGYQVISASRAKIGLTANGTAVTPEVGVGSVVGDGSANATIGAADATMEDLNEGFAVADTDTAAEVDGGLKVATAGALTGIALNDPADAKTLYLNCAATWNADNTGNVVANGEVLIMWTSLP